MSIPVKVREDLLSLSIVIDHHPMTGKTDPKKGKQSLESRPKEKQVSRVEVEGKLVRHCNARDAYSLIPSRYRFYCL